MFEGVRKGVKKEGCRSLHIRIWVDQRIVRMSEKRAFAEEVREALEKGSFRRIWEIWERGVFQGLERRIWGKGPDLGKKGVLRALRAKW